MARLRKPLVPPGAAEEFFARLHELHAAAGWPSVRDVQRRTRTPEQPTGINPTTIHDAFSAPRLARWEVVRAIVARLGGDVDEFHGLWRRARAGMAGPDREQVTRAAARSPVPVPHQIPPAVGMFTGRTAELAQLDRTLTGTDPTVRVSVVVGTAGVGKTTLVNHWANLRRDEFPDGQLYANLRGFDPVLDPVPAATAARGFLHALGVPAGSVPDEPQAQLSLFHSVTADRGVLVVLDNARDAEQVRPLLPAGRSSAAVVTSRDNLAGLVATSGADVIILHRFTDREALDLLVRRIGSARVAASPDAIRDLPRRCAYLPLALAIASARAATAPGLPLLTLVKELADEEPLDAFDAGDVQTDLRAVFQSSYRALPPAVARTFRLLGLHCGPHVTVAAAAAMLGVPIATSRRALVALSRAHLMEQPSVGRFALHDLLRAYAVERAHAVDSGPATREAIGRALDYYLYSTVNADRRIRPNRERLELSRADGPGETFTDETAAMRWLDREYPVLLAAVEWASGAGFDTHAWQLTWSLVTYFDLRGRWLDWAATADLALAAAQRSNDVVGLANTHRELGRSRLWLGRFGPAAQHLDRATALFARLGDRIGEARTLLSVARLHENQGRPDRAVPHLRRALGLYETIGDVAGQASALNLLGWQDALTGEHHRALVHCRRALELFRACRDAGGEANTLDTIGYAYRNLGDHRRAVAHHQRAVDLSRQVGDRYNEAVILSHLGQAHRSGGDADAARTALGAALTILDRLGHPDADDIRLALADLA